MVNERRKIINHFPNYSSFHSSRPMRDWSGVLVPVRQELNASEVPEMNQKFEIVKCVFIEDADTVKICRRLLL